MSVRGGGQDAVYSSSEAELGEGEWCGSVKTKWILPNAEGGKGVPRYAVIEEAK